MPKFFPQFHLVFAKVFIDENTVISEKFPFFNIFCFFLNLVIRQIIVYGLFWFFFLDIQWQRSISICSFILSLFLINSCNLISKSSQVLFGVSSIPFICKLFSLDLSSNYINFEDTSFGSKRSFLIAMVSCSRFIWITNSSDHRKVWTVNLLHTK